MAIIQLNNVGYHYKKTDKDVFNGLNFGFEPGRVYSIIGKSGAGKTTLLSLLSGLAVPTSGQITFQGKDLAKINRYDYRSEDVGVVFQQFNLLPHLTTLENIILSLDASGKKFSKSKKEIALGVLKLVNLPADYADRKILKLSGGEQQRVAIARALCFDPQVLLADEPTGNLDLQTQNEIMEIFKRLAHEFGKCVIIVTHSPEVAQMSDQVMELSKL